MMTAYDLAQRFVGELHELKGAGKDEPFIQWCFTRCGYGPDTTDEVPWCSAFANAICWMLRLPRSKSAAARSWLTVGLAVTLDAATPGYDVVILKRAGSDAGPEVLHAAGHVGFFSGLTSDRAKVIVLGGNQSDGVSLESFPVSQVLGVRRVKPLLA
jgi:uncharacterized protein (TIGR02594 family)